jgi:ribosomal protein S10
MEKQTQAETSSVHRIRIVLTACNVRSLEKVCADLISGAKKQKLRVKVSKYISTNPFYRNHLGGF